MGILGKPSGANTGVCNPHQPTPTPMPKRHPQLPHTYGWPVVFAEREETVGREMFCGLS